MSSTNSMYRRQQTWSNQHQLRKQRSFIETTLEIPDRDRETLSRRSQSERGKLLYLHKQRSVVVDKVRAGPRCQSEQRSKGFSSDIGGSGGGVGAGGTNAGGVKSGGTYRIGGRYSVPKGVKIAWGSNTLDGGDSVEFQKHNSQAGLLVSSSKKNGLSRHFTSERLKKSTTKPENKINLNIVLNQIIKPTENEVVSSDIESSSDSVDTTIKEASKHPAGKKSPTETASKKSLEKRVSSAAQRRAQFQASRSDQQNNSIAHTIPSHATPLSAASFTVQPRPPLVRAMSAPVRSLDDTTKNILSNHKRKIRRRKTITRNASCDKGDNEQVAGKKVLSRSRSVIATDVITLVSLASSEGSDSEKEDSTSATDDPQSGRAPSLRKAGKSVSFQENEQPNFQTVIKEYPHMLRRGSIAPLVARLKFNRPTTAPPVSIFLAEYENCKSLKMSQHEESRDDLAHEPIAEKENNNFTSNSMPGEPPVEYNFPGYVRSMKERECWKLFQKMSSKGVTVSYDTIFRGMLTPTEFRQLQKQRDAEAAKAKEAEENQALVEKK